MKTIIIVQARLSSLRLPGKMLMHLDDVPLYQYVLERCQNSLKASEVVLATSDQVSDQPLAEHAQKAGFKVFRGSLDLVLQRFIDCGRAFDADLIVRVCGDSPFVDVALIDSMIDMMQERALEYIIPERDNIVAGLLSEVVSLEALEKVAKKASKDSHWEHVTSYIAEHKEQFNCEFFPVDLLPDLDILSGLTVDQQDDYEEIVRIASDLSGFDRRDFSTAQLFEVISKLN